jgi:hypothetical protein
MTTQEAVFFTTGRTAKFLVARRGWAVSQNIFGRIKLLANSALATSKHRSSKFTLEKSIGATITDVIDTTPSSLGRMLN